jgi:hypothetical protein
MLAAGHGSLISVYSSALCGVPHKADEQQLDNGPQPTALLGYLPLRA